MEKKYKFSEIEGRLYKKWEENGLFRAKVDKTKKPFSIILPPPNANADLHVGHAMYVYEDIMIRFYKLLGFNTFWLAGADHAGFETWYVFEKHLKKEGKTRFSYGRDELYKMVWKFVMKYRGEMENQLRRLGFALDWEKKRFTLDPEIVSIVYSTFEKLYKKGLIYRAKRLVNYCTKCGTSFSDLEVTYKEVEGKLWFIKYPLVKKVGDVDSIIVATTRPETMFGDVAVAVNPKDKRYKKLIGKEVYLPLTSRKIPIISDLAVDPEFGTGAVKVTPAHDETDWQIGMRHSLPLIQVIDFDGRLNENAGEEFRGLKVKAARSAVIDKLREEGFLVKERKHLHRVGHCYKCGNVIEPLPKDQWFIKIRPLAEKAKKAVEQGKIRIYPSRFKKILINWLDKFYDWNISRQIVWGIRIPAYFCQSKKKWFVSTTPPKKCLVCGGDDFVQDEDTFDTWFSSAQWPFATLKSLGNEFFEYFYPTSVMETGYDILPWWVARMIMIGIFATGEVPFKIVYLHGLVRDKKGLKMSKSKGNVINPMEIVDKYGADALRSALVFETQMGGDVFISEEKIKGMRNFANKIWNIGRFVYLSQSKKGEGSVEVKGKKKKVLDELRREFEKEKKSYIKEMKGYKFSSAFSNLYYFVWHRFADFYLEELKELIWRGNMETLNEIKSVYLEMLKMLHPFIPFVTEAVWQKFKGDKSFILNERLKI